MKDEFITRIKQKVGLNKEQSFTKLIGKTFCLKISNKDLLQKSYDTELYGSIIAASFGPNEKSGIIDDLFGVKLSLQVSNTMIVRSTSYLNHDHRNQENCAIILRCDDNGLAISYTISKQLHDSPTDTVVENELTTDCLTVII